QSPRLNSTPSASPRSRVSLCLHAFPTRRSSDLNLGRYRPQHPGLDRRYPCDRREPAGHRGLCVRGARGGHSWDRGPPRAGGTALGLVAPAPREWPQEAFEELRGPAVHEPEVDEALGLVTPVRHMQDTVEFRPEEAEVSRSERVRSLMASHLAHAGAGFVELRGRNRSPCGSNGQLDRPPGLRVDEEPRGPALLRPAHAVVHDRVVHIHRLPAEPQVPSIRQPDHDEVGRSKDEVRRGDDVIPGRGLHAAPINSAANGGVYVIMSCETRRTMSTPVTSDG